MMLNPNNGELRDIRIRAVGVGRDAGKGAAGLALDGNTSRETYARVLAMIEDGDPELWDSCPSPRSGEWADDPTEEDILNDCGVSFEDCRGNGVWWQDEDTIYVTVDEATEILNAWQDGYSEGWVHELERVARYHLASEG